MRNETRRDFLTTGLAAAVGLEHLLPGAAPQREEVGTIARLAGRGGDIGTMVLVQGYHMPGDGGGGLFVMVPTPAAKDHMHPRSRNAIWTNADRKQAKWIRILSANEPVNAKWFGARGDAKADAAEAITDAIWVSGYLGIRRVHIPAGSYRVDTPIVMSWVSGFELTGDGPLTTTLEKQAAGTASTEALESEIDTVILIPGGSRKETADGFDTHRVRVRGLQLKGKPAAEGESFERQHGIYVERSYGCTFEDLTFAHFEKAFTAEKLWMSTLKHLIGKHISTLIDMSMGPRNDPIAGASTSLNIENCYCSGDVRGDAYVFRSVYYSTIQQCGADEVQGYPVIFDSCKSVNLIGCGFEQSQSGKGILLKGSRASMMGVKAMQPHAPTGDKSVALIEVRADERDQPSSAVLIGCHFSNYGSPRQNKSLLAASEDKRFDRIVEPGSRLVSVGTRYPGNTQKSTRMPEAQRGGILDLDANASGGLTDLSSARSGSPDGLQRAEAILGDSWVPQNIQGTRADDAINANFSKISAALDAILDAL